MSYLMPLAIVMGALAVACAVWAVVSGRAKFLAVAAVCFLTGAGAFGADWYIVTEAEKVEAHVRDLAEAVVAGDSEKALSYFSVTAIPERLAVATGMSMATFDDDLSLSDWSTVVTANDTQAVSGFRANGTIRVAQIGELYKPSMWELVWRKEAGEWKIVDVHRFDPITEKPIGLLDRR
ncbi:hypothetical protein [Alienimonas chondri]|uniref:hypothetical protein n=1 Tax=Alienimonas chondri TaxID=2681879 RepID=UPI001489D5A6|nr:hypothetical protein [Alienimonas chondri]